jgi:CRISPR-associated protein Cas1
MKVVVETYGAQLSLQTGMLVVETDHKKEEISLLHITSIHIHTHARLSSALIIECVKSHIPIYFEDKLQIEAMIWSPRYGSISNIRKKQALFSYSLYKYVLIKKLLIRKNEERAKWIKQITTKKELHEWAEQMLEINLKIQQAPPQDNYIRSLEAHSSKIFFTAFNALLPAKYRFDKRTYRNSKDIVNISLNYAYGILYNEITKALIVAGLDPDMGFFHASQYNKPALTFDMIEPYRPWAEQNLFKVLKKPEFIKLENPIEDQGKLNKTAKHILIEEMENFLQKKKIVWNKRIKTPQNHIRLDAHQTAQYLLKFSQKQLLADICRDKTKKI